MTMVNTEKSLGLTWPTRNDCNHGGQLVSWASVRCGEFFSFSSLFSSRIITFTNFDTCIINLAFS